MTKKLYHFTDSARLPHILNSGELRPGCNKIGGFPDPDFLWATRNELGDRTSSSYSPYRKGLVLFVRITVPFDEFFPWFEVPSRFPQWAAHSTRLENSLKGESVPLEWFCRNEPLPQTLWLGIEVKKFSSPWRKLETNSLIQGRDGFLGVSIFGDTVFSRKIVGPQGQDAYELGKADKARA